MKLVPVAMQLAAKMPEWRPDVLEQYPNGNPKVILYYGENDEGKEIPLKRLSFYPSGVLQEESDLVTIAEDEPAFKEWEATIVPHGVSLLFTEEGKPNRIGQFKRGLLHGEMQTFYPDGNPQHTLHFKNGKRHGKACSYFAEGKLAEEGAYTNGELDGDLVRYYPDGSRKSLITYENGKPVGKGSEWYESGMLFISKNFVDGKLHSEKDLPCLYSL